MPLFLKIIHYSIQPFLKILTTCPKLFFFKYNWELLIHIWQNIRKFPIGNGAEFRPQFRPPKHLKHIHGFSPGNAQSEDYSVPHILLQKAFQI